MIEITEYPHTSPDLWAQLGPLAANATIQKEMGSPIVSNEGFRWFLASVPDGNGHKIVGFGSLDVKKNTAVITTTYFLESHRTKASYNAMLKARMAVIKKLKSEGLIDHASAFTNADQKPLLEAAGFVEMTARGRFFTMRLDFDKT